MKRFSGHLIATISACRWCASTTEKDANPEGAVFGKLGKEAIEQFEMEQRDAEAKVDSRKVLFSSGVSSDHRPRVAAAEAFDLAAAALPTPPNFAMCFVSVDNSLMVDVPEAVWGSMVRQQGVTNPVMLGSAVRFQRPGNGHVQVLAGTIPDLSVDTFTLDYEPSAEELWEPSRPSPFLGMCFVDPNLAISHEGIIGNHLHNLSKKLKNKVPIVGNVCAPIHQKDGTDKGSMFYFNDTIYNGSAAVALLRSNMLEAQVRNVVPSIGLGKGTITSLTTTTTDGVTSAEISSIDKTPVIEVIKGVYETHLADREKSKVFLGIRHGEDQMVPLTFRGDREKGTIVLTLPTGVKLVEGDEVHFVADDDEMDSEASASELFGWLESNKNAGETAVASVEKNVTVQREGKKYLTCSSVGGLHFSHPGMNQIAQRNDLIDFTNNAVLHAPSILQRCIGTKVPSTGAFSPGQVIDLGNSAKSNGSLNFLGSRSSVFTMLVGKE